MDFFKLKIKRRLPLIRIDIFGIKYYFLLDTGATYSMLNSNYFNDNELVNKIYDSKIYGLTSKFSETIVFKQISFINNYNEYKLTGIVNDLNYIERLLNVRFGGIIGNNFFGKKSLFLSYKRKKMYFLDSKNKKNILNKKKKIELVEYNITNNIKYISVEILNNKCNFILDTGASLNILSNRFFDNFRKNFIRLVKNIEITGFNGNYSNASIYISKKVRVSDKIVLKYKLFSVVEMEDVLEFLESDIRGILGYSFFKKYELLFDYKNKKLFIMR